MMGTVWIFEVKIGEREKLNPKKWGGKVITGGGDDTLGFFWFGSRGWGQPLELCKCVD